MPEFSLGEFEFFWQVADSGFGELPASLPFRFGIQESSPYLLRRLFDQSDLETLRLMYRLDSNVGYLQESNSMGVAYARDLLHKIKRLRRSADSAFSQTSMPRVLEIGCGGAVVLQTLATDHMTCVGIDPSPISIQAVQGTKIELISDFFPNQLGGEKFDFIFNADVLEHVEDPIDFLRTCAEHLVDEGLLLVSVPDCTKSIRMGDVSMALHQHLSYFDETSLRRVFQEAGFVNVSVEQAGYGGSLYAVGTRPRLFRGKATQDSRYGQLLDHFFKNASSSVAAVEARVKHSLQSQRSVGMYVPLRALPYLGRDDYLRKSVSSLRLFDDTPMWKGKRIQGGLRPIEDFSQLLGNPVDHLFVMSLTFGSVIAEKVMQSLGPNIQIDYLETIIS